MVIHSEKRLTILVVQQEDYERQAMVSFLDKGKLKVLAARDGNEARDILQYADPDILVTDMALEGINGVQLIEEARGFLPEIKVVVAYSPYSPRLLMQVVEMGVDGFVQLPADGKKLRRAVMRCVKEIAATRHMAEADYSLHRLLDFFPTPAVLMDGMRVSYINRRLASFLGYDNHATMNEVDMGLEDFIVRVGEEPYEGDPAKWIRDIVDDPLDRDHVLHIENPRHPDGKPNVFSVTFNQFPGSDLRLFTFQDVSALEDERAHLEDEASTDPLTRALNRRSFLRVLGQSAAMGEPFALVMFDIDHFKSINDTYGHDVGDAVLREIAQLVRDNIRENDILARWGGEEFMVLSPGSDKGRARQVAERLRCAVADSRFTGVPRQVTSSFGVAVHVTGESGDAMVKRADTALYGAKETGRNRVVVG